VSSISKNTAAKSADPAVRALSADEEAEWDTFVRSHPDGTVFHSALWTAAIRRTFGHATTIFVAERGGEIVGGVPLTHVRSRLFDHALISNGFAVQGGILAHDAATRKVLDAASLGLGRRLGVDFVEYRHERPVCADRPRRDDLYATFRKPIAPDDETNLKRIPRKQRAMVRKAMNKGLTSYLADDVATLYDIYALSVRNLGTPVFTKRLFEELKRGFGEACQILVITHGDTPVAAVMSFRDGRVIRPYYGGGTAAARGLAANDFMYWEVMRRARADGCDTFDFGRSKVGTGAYDFKKNWGFTPVPLCYEYALLKARSVPETNPTNPKYRAAIAVWKRLPVAATKWIGPPIARGLP
jgi:FemAB-related protein (PEP-CTERM system-associated)